MAIRCNLLDVSGLLRHLTLIEPRPATDAEILRFHTREYLERIRAQNDLYAAESGLFTPMVRVPKNAIRPS